MSDITRLESGPRMSQAVIHNGIVYLAGQVGAPGASVAEQTKAVLAAIDRLLAAAGPTRRGS
jgi:enamine deaminase RidA (YjgF/YER057c/UK114 family)